MVTPVLAAIWAGELGQAESWLQTIDTGPAAPEWTSAVANWLRAVIAERRGDQRAALEILRRAAVTGARAVPFYRAHLLSDLARLEQDGGDRRRAVDAANTALTIYRGLGATTYLDRPHLRLEQGDPTESARPEGTEESLAGPLRVLGARYQLSDRELDVLTLLPSGLSMKQIAQQLFITTSTVSFHLCRIYAKTGVHSRHQLTGILRGQARPA